MYRVRFVFLLLLAVLLAAELVAPYDVLQRRVALATTNVIAASAVLLLDRFLRRRTLPPLNGAVFVAVAVAVALDAFGNFFGWYGSLSWWDDFTHMVGTAAVAVTSASWLASLTHGGRVSLSWGMRFLFALSIATLVSAFYEVTEYWGDIWFATERIGDRFDTASDLMYNIAGSVLALFIFYRKG